MNCETTGGCYELTDQFLVRAELSRVWEFFSTAANLSKITPAWLKFQIVMPEPVIIELNAHLDYTLSWMGLKINWRTQIIEWESPMRFVDLQVRGPYALWHHEHRFEPQGDGVMCWDRVLYRVPLEPVGRLVHRFTVGPQLRAIFQYRRKVISRELGTLTPVRSDIGIRRI